ncbi:MAG: hypothetical protein RMJ44_02875 [Cytophagales bacterium]|nr:hypothetical protein [Bernardetiaceae bacterium]MDW8210006.1 hypothetical protein [Cytophagales bacterium]
MGKDTCYRQTVKLQNSWRFTLSKAVENEAVKALKERLQKLNGTKKVIAIARMSFFFLYWV